MDLSTLTTPFGINPFRMSTTVKTRRMCYILMASILLTHLVGVKSKPLFLFDASTQQAPFKQSSTVADEQERIQGISKHAFDSTQGNERKTMLKSKEKGYKEALRGLSRLGSTPPRCEHKCGGCIPCDPIQIPTNNDLLGTQYANYEPEGWKCKCGNAYFNP
ncbi:EPIDERMAL PATTERNING FACTOR-like protein 6 [Vigna radiata var. radiata]|uniref:Epidermal patterning factor-like protein n=1 Tax=Vigna radiata var. radiata TaxID=3916 RepID=A0A1S3TYZ2_VIGRR|nr:EPIDERMAL PATTERNING FACTOR-like protein 6 [Vigna radiata var. radiata]